MTPDLANPVVHLELHTGDLPRARAFYTRALRLARRSGSTPARGSYLALELGGGIGGGIVECETRRPLWLPYVEVAEIAEATERARAARGLGAARAARGPGRLAQRRRRARRRRDRLLAAEALSRRPMSSGLAPVSNWQRNASDHRRRDAMTEHG